MPEADSEAASPAQEEPEVEKVKKGSALPFYIKLVQLLFSCVGVLKEAQAEGERYTKKGAAAKKTPDGTAGPGPSDNGTVEPAAEGTPEGAGDGAPEDSPADE